MDQANEDYFEYIIGAVEKDLLTYKPNSFILFLAIISLCQMEMLLKE